MRINEEKAATSVAEQEQNHRLNLPLPLRVEAVIIKTAYQDMFTLKHVMVTENYAESTNYVVEQRIPGVYLKKILGRKFYSSAVKKARQC